MADLEQKLQQISQAIINDAKNESAKINNQAEQFKQERLKKAEDEILNELYVKMQHTLAETKEETARKIAKFEFDSRQQLLKIRDETANSVFNAVRQRLLAYSQSDEYKSKLITLAAELAKQHGDVIISLKPQDSGIFEEIKAACKGAEVKITEDKAIKIGGFILTAEQKGVVIDYTLDSRLEGQKTWFYANSGLSIS
ncbi:MAG TPA: hypothetical protein DCP97_03605 [Ruminococcaceae bacterium]|nr:hypothetical protein [Oscillospiraceae bacterium]